MNIRVEVEHNGDETWVTATARQGQVKASYRVYVTGASLTVQERASIAIRMAKRHLREGVAALNEELGRE